MAMYNGEDEAYQEQPQGQQYSAQAGSNATAPTSASIVTGGTPNEPPARVETPNFQAISPAPPPRGGLFFPPPDRSTFQLGGASPDVSSLLMAEMLRPTPPPQVNVWDALQAFGAGIQGQAPQYLQRHALEQEQQERRFKNLAGIVDLQQRRAQQEQELALKRQDAYMKMLDVPREYHTLPVATQNATRDWYESKVRTMAMQAGVEVPDAMIATAFDNKETSDRLRSLVASPHYTPEERQQHYAYLAQVDPKEQRAYMRQVEDDKVRDLTTYIDPRLGQWVTEYRKMKGLAVDTPIPVNEIKEYLGTQFPDLQDDPITRRAFLAATRDKTRLAELNVIPGEVRFKGMETEAEQIAKGPELTATARTFLAALYTDENGKPMIPAKATSAQIKKANDAAAAFELKKATDQGLAVETFKMGLPMPGDELAKYVDVNALVKDGRIVKPPPGTTRGQLYGQGSQYRYASDKQQAAVLALDPTRTQLDHSQVLADRLIKARNVGEALAQGVTLSAGAYSGAIPEAKAYLDSQLAFIGNMARVLGGQTGVLTDADVERMQRGAYASFFDTADAKNIKKAIINDMYAAGHAAAVAAIAGNPQLSSEHLERAKGLNDQLARLDAQSIARQYRQQRPSDRVFFNENTRKLGVVKPGQSLPKGSEWKELK